ncbi:MAG: shikimate dehydrogenase [Kiritimatiellia bacterium]|jgi:shikimate dehydrogenase|nr:shikimate dehydrogenase [Kiritimatiellia bacterium]MDP6811258.1 shikimate dehydrogenase [Kiritimatiellia bacterium]MDP7024569.1 shikimate dehydrogenase [Kiritimatiellia bacterium]
MNLSGHTQPFAVLGHPIGHTLSPVMHNVALQALEMDAIYLAFDVAPERLMSTLPAMADMGFRGVNLTVPLKEVAFQGINDLADTASLLGAVNTVEFGPDGLRGHNTDGVGFLRAVDEAFGCDVVGKSVMMLGCGGAGRAVALTCASQGAGRLILTDLDMERVARLSEELKAVDASLDIQVVEASAEAWTRSAGEAELLVQATPVGMKPEDEPLLGKEAFEPGQMLLDLVYMYPETGLMTVAREAGAKVANGLGMLLHQGVRSFEIWTGRTPPVERMREALEARVYGA